MIAARLTERTFDLGDNGTGPATQCATGPSHPLGSQADRRCLGMIMPRASDEDSAPRRVPTSVYLYYDKHDVLLYVGITSRGIARNIEHNTSKEWFRFVTRQEVEHHKSRGAALNRENQLIRHYHPPFNTQGNPSHAAAREAYYLFRETPSNARRAFLERGRDGKLPPSGKRSPMPESLPKTLWFRLDKSAGGDPAAFVLASPEMPPYAEVRCSAGLRPKDHKRKPIGHVSRVDSTTLLVHLKQFDPRLLGLVAEVKWPPELSGRACQVMNLRGVYPGGLRMSA